MPVRCENCSDEILRLSVAGVMDVCALRQETFAAALTTPSETGATAFGAHPRAKSVLIFPGAFRAL